MAYFAYCLFIASWTPLSVVVIDSVIVVVVLGSPISYTCYCYRYCCCFVAAVIILQIILAAAIKRKSFRHFSKTC